MTHSDFPAVLELRILQIPSIWGQRGNQSGGGEDGVNHFSHFSSLSVSSHGSLPLAPCSGTKPFNSSGARVHVKRFPQKAALEVPPHPIGPPIYWFQGKAWGCAHPDLPPTSSTALSCSLTQFFKCNCVCFAVEAKQFFAPQNLADVAKKTQVTCQGLRFTFP